MSMPMVMAASTISVPGGTVSLWPSMVRLTSATGGDSSHVALVSQGVVLVFVAEVPERGVDHPSRRVAQATEAAAVLQPVRDPEQRVDLDLRTLVGEDALVGPDGPVASDQARGAFAA